MTKLQELTLERLMADTLINIAKGFEATKKDGDHQGFITYVRNVINNGVGTLMNDLPREELVDIIKNVVENQTIEVFDKCFAKIPPRMAVVIIQQQAEERLVIINRKIEAERQTQSVAS